MLQIRELFGRSSYSRCIKGFFFFFFFYYRGKTLYSHEASLVYINHRHSIHHHAHIHWVEHFGMFSSSLFSIMVLCILQHWCTSRECKRNSWGVQYLIWDIWYAILMSFSASYSLIDLRFTTGKRILVRSFYDLRRLRKLTIYTCIVLSSIW